MPEHYEVKRISSYLKDGGIEGNKINRLECFSGAEKILKEGSLSHWESWLVHQEIRAISVKAKYTFLELNYGTLVWHYRFTGIPHIMGLEYGARLYTIFNLPTQVKGTRFCRFQLHFEDGKLLQYFDTRCLSDIRYFPRQKPKDLDIYQKLAPDLSAYVPISFADWKKEQIGKKRNLKQELQDQSTYPSGIGNYLACEILAHAGINPWLSVKDLDAVSYQRLCQAILEVKELCEKSASYDWFYVFKKNECATCYTSVERRKHGSGNTGQTTHYCPQCQA